MTKFLLSFVQYHPNYHVLDYVKLGSLPFG